MIKIFFFCLLSLNSSAALSQIITQKGIVTLQNSNNTPVVGAQIKTLWASPVITRSRGDFELKFANKEPGSEVEITIDYKGYEVVNKKETTFNLNPNKVIRFYLCKKGEWEKNALAYYNINFEKLKIAYDKRFKSLNTNDGSLSDSSKILEAQFIHQQKQLLQTAEYFAKLNLDNTDSLTKKLFQEFKKGNYEGIQKVLSIEKFDLALEKDKQKEAQGSEIEKIGRSITAEAREGIQKKADMCIILARAAYLNYNFEQAISYFETYRKYDSSNRYLNLKYAQLLIEQKNEKGFAISQKIIQQNLLTIDSIFNLPIHTNALFSIVHDLGTEIMALYIEQKNINNAKNILDRLLLFYTSASNPSIETILDNAVNISSYAQLSISTREFYDPILKKNEIEKQKSLVSLFQNAFSQIDSLEKATAVSHPQYKINILYAWANFYNDINMVYEAIDLFKQCNILEPIKSTPDSFFLIQNYNRIVVCFRKLKLFDSSFYYSTMALNVLNSIKEIDSLTYKETFLKIKGHILYTLYLSARYHEYNTTLQSTTTQYESLYSNNPNRYAIALHSHYKNAADVLFRMNRLNESLIYLESDLKVLNRSNLFKYSAETYDNMAIIYEKMGKIQDSDSALKIAIEIQDRVVQTVDSTSASQFELYKYKYRYARSLYIKKEFEPSLAYLLPLKDLLIRLNKRENSAYESYLIDINRTLRAIYYSIHKEKIDTLEKIYALENSICYSQTIVDSDSSDINLYDLANHYLAFYKVTNKLEYLLSGLAHAKKVYSRNSMDVDNLLILFYMGFISECLKNCLFSEGLKYSLEAFSFFPNSSTNAYVYLFGVLSQNKKNYDPYIYSWSSSEEQKRSILLEFVQILEATNCLSKKEINLLRKSISRAVK